MCCTQHSTATTARGRVHQVSSNLICSLRREGVARATRWCRWGGHGQTYGSSHVSDPVEGHVGTAVPFRASRLVAVWRQ